MNLRRMLGRIFRGRPVTHEEQQAARRALPHDPVVRAQQEARSARFIGMRL